MTLRRLIPAALAVAFLASGCMSDKEYMLRKYQLKAQAQHPTTYQPLSIDGPIKIELAEGGTIRLTTPNQPFREIPIPDGVRTQTDLVKHLIDIGAISVLGWKAIDAAAPRSIETTPAPAAPAAP